MANRPEIALIYKTDIDLFNKTAREWTEKYAMPQKKLKQDKPENL